MVSPDRPLRWAELAALLITALLALAFQLGLPGRLPTEDDYRAVADVLAREARPGDVVLLSPWWAERARLFAPAGLQVVGYQDSEADPLTPWSRIWVLSQPRLPGTDEAAFERAFLPRREALGERRAFGNLRLQLFKNGRHRPTRFSAAEAIAQARVYIEEPGGPRLDCPFDGRAHQCPGGLHVGTEWHEIRFQPRHCVWVAPPGGRRRLVVEFPQVPRGAHLTLEGGLTWDRGYFRGPEYSATRFGVEEAGSGRPLLEVTLPPGLEGVQHAETAPPAGDGPLAVKLWSQADRPELRELCVDLFSQGEDGEEGP